MKHKYSLLIKLKRLFISLLALLPTLPIFLSLAASAVSQHYFIRPLRTGDTIYFDNWDANWGKVRIYMYNSTTDSSEITWADRPFMTYDSGSIYKYTITADMQIEQYGYDYIIFTDDTDQQTINLGFVGNGYAYKVDAWDGSKRSGYWYLYDQSAVTIQYIQSINTGDEIYFDNSGTNWDTVRIYLYSTIDGGSELYSWADRPSMEYVSGSIYKFVATPDLDIEEHKDNHLIFTNGADAQTINLGFIDTGYAYKVESWTDGKAIGYWYVYDKTSLIDAVAAAEAYLAKLDCLSDSDTASLRYAISYAELAINSEVPVETEVVGNTEEYWNQVDTEEAHLNGIMQQMVDLYGESPVICEETPEPDDPDNPGNPDEPGEPDSPETPGDDEGDDGESEDDEDTTEDDAAKPMVVPNTGVFTNDGGGIILGAGIFGIALATGITTVFIYSKKHHI